MKWISRVLTVSVLLAVTVLASIYVYEYVTGAKRSGILSLQGLQAEVTVQYDEWGVPHIHATHDQDAFFALGYIQAQDRLNQMEGLRRIAQGRLAEIIGERGLGTDRFFRRLGIHRYAKRYVAELALEAPHRQLAEAYLAGVNLFVQHGPQSMLTSLAFGEIAPFKLEDMVSIAAYMAFTFDRGLKVDSWVFELSNRLDQAYLNELQIIDPATQMGMHRGGDVSSEWWAMLDQLDQFMDDFGRFDGSNAWVLSGERSVSGKPILANDTHIRYSNPSVWYEAYIKSPHFDIYGHFLSGVSVPILGHGPEHGWGITIFHNNDVDLVFEDIARDPNGRLQAKSSNVSLRSYEEKIAVRGGDPQSMTVYESNIGPVFDDLITSGQPVTMQWNYYKQDRDNLLGFYELMQATDLARADAAVQKIEAPSLNILYANQSGDIAWWVRGKIRHFSDPFDAIHPQYDGADSPTVQQSRENPFLVNPVSGVIASTNEQPDASIQGYYSYPQRKQRLAELLSERQRWTTEQLQAVQTDIKISYHRDIIDRWQALQADIPSLRANDIQRKALDALAEWDGEHQLAAIGPTIFYEFCYQILRLGMQDEMGPDMFERFLASEIPLKALLYLHQHPDSRWWDLKSTDTRETQADIYRMAWQQSWQELNRLYGDDVSSWHWGKHHQLTLQHPLSRSIPWLGWLLDIGPLPVVGGMETLNQISFSFGSGPRVPKSGPATRRLIDFAQPELSYGVIPSGQSERFLDPHYDDQVDSYLASEYRFQRFKLDPDQPGFQQLVLTPKVTDDLMLSRGNDVEKRQSKQ